ncbi:hypothetical protein ACFOGI_04130 [Virgibacillus xinjiangensis]|uniref:Uncharacterized protein n=1 Tax=Virgibacillus xinjiangensis TaxID=393090 RepID=A0ABV7CT43_9BACI
MGYPQEDRFISGIRKLSPEEKIYPPKKNFIDRTDRISAVPPVYQQHTPYISRNLLPISRS